jgi:hypothetical protein
VSGSGKGRHGQVPRSEQRGASRQGSPGAARSSLSRSPAGPQQWRAITFAGRALAIPGDPACDDDASDPANQLLAEYAAVAPSSST